MVNRECFYASSASLRHLCLNSSVAGPAGSGKTESIKELALHLGLLCIVFNCSDTVDLYVLDKIFAGRNVFKPAQAGDCNGTISQSL